MKAPGPHELDSAMQSGTIRRFALTSVLLIAVMGASVLAAPRASSAPALVAVSGTSPFAGCPPQSDQPSPPSGRLYRNAEVEPFVAINPIAAGTDRENLIGVWQQDRWSDGAAQGLVAASSLDSGRTWTETPLPFSTCASESAPFRRASDPWVSIGPDGTAYAVALTIGPAATAVLASTSKDGGKTWSKSSTIISDPRSAFFNDKEMVVADPTRPSVAYVTWDRAQQPLDEHNQATWFARTTDGGKTWRTREIIPATSTRSTFIDQLAVDPRSGVIYLVYDKTVWRQQHKQVCVKRQKGRCVKRVSKPTGARHASSYLGFNRSTDGGTNWSKSKNITLIARAAIGEADEGEQAVAPHFAPNPGFRIGGAIPSVAVDPTSGKLYVAWWDSLNATRRLRVMSTSNRGASWSKPVVIRDGTDTISVLPAIAVNAAGKLGLLYYDLARPLDTPPVQATCVLRTSKDGVHFSAPARIGGPFDFTRAPLAGGYFIGDYQGLTAAGKRFYPFFAMATAAGETNPVDIFTTTIGQ